MGREGSCLCYPQLEGSAAVVAAAEELAAVFVEDGVVAVAELVVAAEGLAFGAAIQVAAAAAAGEWVALAVVVVGVVAAAVELGLATAVAAAVDSGCWLSTG